MCRQFQAGFNPLQTRYSGNNTDIKFIFVCKQLRGKHQGPKNKRRVKKKGKQFLNVEGEENTHRKKEEVEKKFKGA